VNQRRLFRTVTRIVILGALLAGGAQALEAQCDSHLSIRDTTNAQALTNSTNVSDSATFRSDDEITRLYVPPGYNGFGDLIINAGSDTPGCGFNFRLNGQLLTMYTGLRSNTLLTISRRPTGSIPNGTIVDIAVVTTTQNVPPTGDFITACTVRPAQPEISVPLAGGAVSVPVIASRPDCRWWVWNTASAWIRMSGTAALPQSTQLVGSAPIQLQVDQVATPRTGNILVSGISGYVVRINQADSNNDLRVTTTFLPTATSGVPYLNPLTASGGSGNYTWSAAGLPNGFSINSNTIGTTGCPPATPGMHNVTLLVTDNVTGKTASSSQLSLDVKSLPLMLSPLRINQGVDLVADGQVNSTVSSGSIADAVENRSTLIETRVQVGETVAHCLDSMQVPFQLTLENVTGTVLQMPPPKLESVGNLRGGKRLQWFESLPRPDTTTLSVVVQIDPQNGLNLIKAADRTQSELLTVRPLGRKIQYLFREWAFGVQSFNDTVTKSMDFVHGVFPVPEGTVSLSYSIGSPFDPFNEDLNATTFAKQYDMLWEEARKQVPIPERVIAVVPQSWFNAYMPGSDGVTMRNGKVAFVVDNSDNVVAHELGHTYGFPDSYQKDANDRGIFGTGAVANIDGTGFWVQKRAAMDPHTIEIMGADYTTWISDSHFASLFQNFRQNSTDPEVLLISGIIHPNRSVEIWRMNKSDSGEVTDNQPGDGIVRIVTRTGTIISSVSFDSQAQPTDVPSFRGDIPFVASLPFPAGTFRVQVLIAGTVMAETNVSTKLLRDAVNSIPDSGFDQNPSQRRNALLEKVTALDEQLSADAIQGARNKLQNDILKALQDWLRDSYAVRSPLQYTKPQILSLVNELIHRVGQ